MQKKDLIKFWKDSGLITNERLLSVFSRVKREFFVLDEKEAYEDRALPILNQQTISQPSTVMIMLQSLEINENNNILEIGTGSGYNLALMCKLVKGDVYSVEIYKSLVELSDSNLKKAKIKNYKIYHRNGYFGLREQAPFDRIIVTAAPKEIPLELIKQLKIDGIMIVPVGEYSQKLIKIIKKKDRIIKIDLGDFLFVPMVR